MPIIRATKSNKTSAKNASSIRVFRPCSAKLLDESGDKRQNCPSRVGRGREETGIAVKDNLRNAVDSVDQRLRTAKRISFSSVASVSQP